LVLLLFLVACGGSAKKKASKPLPVHHPTPTVQATATPAKPAAPPPVEDKKDVRPMCQADTDMPCLFSIIEYFQRQMCACTNKVCADTVLASLTEWSQTLTKDWEERKVDEATTKRATEILTKLTECRSKIIEAENKATDPCGGHETPAPNPCGD
jgi:hypothetical protein